MLSIGAIGYLRRQAPMRTHVANPRTPRTSHISLRYPPLLFDLCARIGGKPSAKEIERFARSARVLCGGDAKWILTVAKDAMARLEEEARNNAVVTPLERMVIVDDIGVHKREWERLKTLSLLSVHPRFASFAIAENNSDGNRQRKYNEGAEFARLTIQCHPVPNVSQEEEEKRFPPVLAIP